MKAQTVKHNQSDCSELTSENRDMAWWNPEPHKAQSFLFGWYFFFFSWVSKCDVYNPCNEAETFGEGEGTILLGVYQPFGRIILISFPVSCETSFWPYFQGQ